MPVADFLIGNLHVILGGRALGVEGVAEDKHMLSTCRSHVNHMLLGKHA